MASSTDTRFFGHPAGLSTLFFTELWERFGYYGMRAILVLFLTASVQSGGMGLDDASAYGIYGLYTGMVWAACLPGGWLADRFFGQQRAVLYGGILIAAGYLSLAIPSNTVFFLGLTLVVCGTGLLKPNASTIVGQLYAPGDERRDGGFSLFYMGINAGAFIAPIVCGWVGQRVDFRLGFAVAGVGMVIGVFWYLAGRKRLGEAGAQPAAVSPAEDKAQRNLLRNFVAGFIALVAGLAALHLSGIYALTIPVIVDGVGLALAATTLGVFGWMMFGGNWTAVERKRLGVIIVLFIAAALFWSAFEQTGSSLNLFAQRHTENAVFGFEFPASWFQSVNAIFLVLLSPVFAWIWVKLDRRQPSSPAKFAWGLFFCGLGFVAVFAGAVQAGAGVRVSPLYLVLTYLCHTIGELCLSPVGLSAITKLAPAKIAGLMMGVWFLSTSAGNYLGGRIAVMYSGLPMSELFQAVAIFAVGAGVVMALLARPVARMMGGVR